MNNYKKLDQQEAQHATMPSLQSKEQHIDASIVQAFQQNLLERDEVEDVNSIFKTLQKAFSSPEPCCTDQESPSTNKHQ